MDKVKIFKALGNETRLKILMWLKSPKENFPLHKTVINDFKNAICVGSIKDKAELSQSTISTFLAMMEEAGLLESRKAGQWTYFRRNEDTIKKISKWINEEL